MEYGLRRYEAAQRLLWLLVFLVSLGFAYLLKGSDAYQRSYPVPTVSAVKSMSFWLDLQGIQVQPPAPVVPKTGTQETGDLQRSIQAGPRILAGIMIYLILVTTVFLGLRSVWLAVQFVGKHLMQILLSANIKKPARRPGMPLESFARGSERFFPAEALAKQVNQFPLSLIFHPFKRLKLMLSHPQSAISAEELTEKERRIADTDWQILWQSWQPFNWVFWALPVLALIQSCSLFYLELLPILSGKREISEVSTPLLTGLIPLIQVVVIAAFLKIASALLKRIDEFYLSNVDALIYDQFLSRLPFQSGDTIILLQAMQKHFQEIQSSLKRIERLYATHSASEEKVQEGKQN